MQPTQTTPTQQPDWRDARHQARLERHTQNQAAGLPVWGVLLILVGAIALFGNFGIGLGWLFGLALGAWFVYLGMRHVQEGGAINWWLVGLGLLIGLGAVTSGFFDQLVFPIVLIAVGLGILAERVWSQQNR
jgi:hypothetical protein